MTTYTLAGGCFWCLDAIYRQLKGVSTVVSGYSGGATEQPSYDEVCGGATGHAEVIQITFDEQIIPVKVILDLYFTIHNPTTLNQQGADRGTQYRSAMFYSGDEQKQIFEDALMRAQTLWEDPIVTEITPLIRFYPAEDYHQDYFNKNPGNGYCNVVITPKMIKARQKFSSYWVQS